MFVIGTAGHVDHGKSTLVKALTGIDPDRLREEKEREMTIDLGFAWLKLPGGREVGVVDVPGHEHFIKNMLAGVSGMDLVLVVVDACEGVRQQTREHVAILDLFEIKKGIGVITKADRADSDTIEIVTLEIDDLLRPTTLAGSPVVAVSSMTSQGLPELVTTIDSVLNTTAPRRDIGKPRLPVDRIFTIAGSGTVVTGTLVDGSLTVGQEIEILPPVVKSRIRSLQTHKTQVTTAGPGSRVAANIVGVDSADLRRGYVLTKPGWLKPTAMVDAKLRLLAEPDRPLRHNTEVSLHTGSAEVMARVRLLENEAVLPGQTTFVQFVFAEPLAAVNGDHYVVRSPVNTLGGGVILESHPAEKHRRFRSEIIGGLKARSEGQTGDAILAALRSKDPQEMATLVSRSNLPAGETGETIEDLIQQGEIVKIGQGQGTILFTAAGWQRVVDSLLALVKDYHRRFPLRVGISRAEITSKVKLGPRLPEMLQRLIDEKVLEEDAGLMRLSSHRVVITPAQQTRIDAFLRQLNQNPYAPAPETELEPDLLSLLLEKGQAVKTPEGIIFARAPYDEMIAGIMAHIRQNGKITVGEVRDMFHSSRKYVLPLLESMDEAKLTKRVGDDRVLGEKAGP